MASFAQERDSHRQFVAAEGREDISDDLRSGGKELHRLLVGEQRDDDDDPDGSAGGERDDRSRSVGHGFLLREWLRGQALAYREGVGGVYGGAMRGSCRPAWEGDRGRGACSDGTKKARPGRVWLAAHEWRGRSSSHKVAP